MAFPKAHSTLRYCGLLLIVFLQQHIVASSTRNYAELMKECDRDFCICINRNVDDAEQCPWDPDYFPAGKGKSTEYSSLFRYTICGLFDSPSESKGSQIWTRAVVGDVNTTQFVNVNATVYTERAITMDDVGVTMLFKSSTTYFYGDERNESFSFTPFDLIPCPSTIDTSTSPPTLTSTPSVAPSSSDSDDVRNDTLFRLMVLVIVDAFVIFGF